MTLIKSISGIRGTIGGPAGDTLNPLDIVKFTSAYATFIRRSGASESNTIVVGRDARISGEMVKNVVCGTLMGMGYDVLNIGLATTPTTELAVTMSGAAGGIIITASHNPRQWNALSSSTRRVSSSQQLMVTRCWVSQRRKTSTMRMWIISENILKTIPSTNAISTPYLL